MPLENMILVQVNYINENFNYCQEKRKYTNNDYDQTEQRLL